MISTQISSQLLAAALLLSLVGLSVAATCSDGFDDVFASALKNWRDNGKQIQTQVRDEAA